MSAPDRSIYDDLEPRRSLTPLAYVLIAIVGLIAVYLMGGARDAAIVSAAGVTLALTSMLR
jgi:hypothetical protein